jgi:hypothetical protein
MLYLSLYLNKLLAEKEKKYLSAGTGPKFRIATFFVFFPCLMQRSATGLGAEGCRGIL